MVSQINNVNSLQWIEHLMGSPVLPVRQAELPRSRFHCRLDDQPDHLVPEHCLRTASWADRSDLPLFVNPRARFTRHGELPEQLVGHSWLLDNFALQADMVWLCDPGPEALQPFWLGTRFRGFLAGVSPGDRAPTVLSPEARRILGMANVLVPANFESQRRQDWTGAIAGLQRQFKQRGYVPVARLIHPFHISALRRYYRCLIRGGALRLGDQQSSRRFVSHNESVARFFHHQLTSTVAAIVAEPVKPSYVYLASYQGGALLEKHTDREQCEFSLTLCVDYSPEPRRETRWPLHLHTPSGKTTVFQAIGDALLYRGRELPHSRHLLPPGNSSTSIFFHYVRQDFDRPLD